MRIYIYTPQVYLRPRNTDWVYSRLLARLPEFNPALDIWLQQSAWSTAVENGRLMASIAKHRCRWPVLPSWMPTQQSEFSRKDVRRARPDVIYGQSPSNIDDVPVIFNCGPTHIERMRESGLSETDIEREKAVKTVCAARATLIASHSRANLETLALYMPQFAGKMRTLPFFLPHLTAISETDMRMKFGRGKMDVGKSGPPPLKLLFVGREARRKGLPEVLQAFQRMCARFPGRLQLQIATNFADGPVEIPDDPGIELLGETPRQTVKTLLEESHFLLMPSHYESYGWIYLEAMAAGCIPVACGQATQREMLDAGRAGILVQVDPGKDVSTTAANIDASISPYLLHPENLEALARESLRFCRTTFFPEVVARHFEELGIEAMDRFQGRA